MEMEMLISRAAVDMQSRLLEVLLFAQGTHDPAFLLHWSLTQPEHQSTPILSVSTLVLLPSLFRP